MALSPHLDMATRGVAGEIAARRANPVRQHPALAGAAIDRLAVARGTMGVAVDDAANRMLPECCRDGVRTYVHDFRTLPGLGLLTAFAQGHGECAARFQWFSKEIGKPAPIPDLGTKDLILGIFGTPGIAVRQEGGRTMKVDTRGVGQQDQSSGSRQIGADEEIAVTRQKMERNPSLRYPFQRGRNSRVEGQT